MKQLIYILISWIAFLFVGCTDELESGVGYGPQEGEVMIELALPSSPVITTRANADNTKEETIWNVAIFVFNDTGDCTNKFYQTSSQNISYVNVYLQSADESVYAVCNYPEPGNLVNSVTSLDDLKEWKLEITAADGAYPGYYVMSGFLTVNSAPEYKISLYRLAAHLEFTVKVEPETAGEDFKISEMYICGIPKGSYLLDGGVRTADTETEMGDWVYNTVPTAMRANYFAEYKLNYEEETDGSISASFDQFENRRGAVEDIPGNWPELNGLENDENYTYYKQLYKRTRAKDYPDNVGNIPLSKDGEKIKEEELIKDPNVQKGQFYNATYLRIDGVYQEATGATYETSYYIYLGADNYRDFNIKRNYWYNHIITIKAYDDYDHRVTGDLLSGLSVYASLEEPLDAHCNVVKALMFAPEDWTVYVENPDETPWLEISTSAVYKPYIIGNASTGDEAAFSISGMKGLRYFYIHTDDYIPELIDPSENPREEEKIREGVIVCECDGLTERLTVKQLPAQMVIYHTNYDPHTMVAVNDTFFIERKLEQKYLPWGFFHYWSFITDDLIASGTWDGLSNTRRLYDVALNGDKWNIEPAYPEEEYPGGIPYDHALGYVIAKNRDRNGNGKIDYNEIMWYWPATKELQAIWDTKGSLDFEGMEETYHASTPSAADAEGITPGFSVYVSMKEGSKWSVGQRDREYNVIACRRKNAWKGPQEGTAGGGVAIDPEWNGEEEIIVPR